jgi:uncharacterized protein YciI
MGLFIYMGFDGPRGAELRPDVRPRHLAHLEGLSAAGRIRFAGPMFEENERPCGSVVVLEAPDLASARAIAEGDPYLTEGVFERVDVRGTAQVLPAED